MKRHHIITVIILSLVLPQLATALPRPPGAIQSKPEQQVCFSANNCDITVSAATFAATWTPQLLQDRSYRIQVEGIWYPTGLSNPNNKADALGCQTTDGVNWGPSPRDPNNNPTKGIEIQNITYSAAVASQCASSHKYSIQITGSGNNQGEPIRIIDTNFQDNAGTLNAQVWAYNEVTWNVLTEVPIGTTIPATPEIGHFDFDEKGASMTVTANEDVPAIGIPAQPLPVPELARVDIRFVANGQCSGNRKQLVLTVTITGVEQFPIADCVPNTTIQDIDRHQLWTIGSTNTPVGGEIPEKRVTGQTTTVGAGPGVSTCDGFTLVFFLAAEEQDRSNCTWTVSKAHDQRSIVEALPPQVQQQCQTQIGRTVCNATEGSAVRLLLSWSADSSKLFKTPVNDRNPSNGSETTAVWAPFHTTDLNWFMTESQTCAPGSPMVLSVCTRRKLDATFKLTVLGRGGETVDEREISIPGLGQFIEALLTTKAAGV